MNVKPKQKHSKEPQPIASTSSHACTKPHVVGSQSNPWMSYEELTEHNKVYLEKIEAYRRKCHEESG